MTTETHTISCRCGFTFTVEIEGPRGLADVTDCSLPQCRGCDVWRCQRCREHISAADIFAALAVARQEAEEAATP